MNNSLAIPESLLGKDIDRDEEFRTQYMLQPLQVGKIFKNTKREYRK